MKKIFAFFSFVLILFVFCFSSFALSGSSQIFPVIRPVVPWELHYISNVTADIESDYPLIGSFSSPSGTGVNTGLNINTVTGGPGLYTMISKRQDAATNKPGILAINISQVLLNKDYNYMPAIFIPATSDTQYNVSYGADPVCYASFTLRNLATDVVFRYTDVPLNILAHLDADRYYSLYEVFRDESFPADMRDAFTSGTNLLVDFSFQIFIASSDVSSSPNGKNILIRQTAFMPYVNEQGVYIDPLRNYYNSTYGDLISTAKNVGYDQGYYIGSQDGEAIGIEKGKSIGYDKGYMEGASKGFDFTSFLASALTGVFNVKIGLITLGSVCGVIISILLIKWILKLVGGG